MGLPRGGSRKRVLLSLIIFFAILILERLHEQLVHTAALGRGPWKTRLRWLKRCTRFGSIYLRERRFWVTYDLNSVGSSVPFYSCDRWSWHGLPHRPKCLTAGSFLGCSRTKKPGPTFCDCPIWILCRILYWIDCIGLYPDTASAIGFSDACRSFLGYPWLFLIF